MTTQTTKQTTATEIYENGKLVGWSCQTWNFDGTKQITVTIPSR